MTLIIEGFLSSKQNFIKKCWGFNWKIYRKLRNRMNMKKRMLLKFVFFKIEFIRKKYNFFRSMFSVDIKKIFWGRNLCVLINEWKWKNVYDKIRICFHVIGQKPQKVIFCTSTTQNLFIRFKSCSRISMILSNSKQFQIYCFKTLQSFSKSIIKL